MRASVVFQLSKLVTLLLKASRLSTGGAEWDAMVAGEDCIQHGGCPHLFGSPALCMECDALWSCQSPASFIMRSGADLYACCHKGMWAGKVLAFAVQLAFRRQACGRACTDVKLLSDHHQSHQAPLWSSATLALSWPGACRQGSGCPEGGRPHRGGRAER